MTSGDNRRIIEATYTAALTHRKHRRLRGRNEKGSRPYIEHPIEVAHILTEDIETISSDALCAAILHDTIEDGDEKQDKGRVNLKRRFERMTEIERKWGRTVAKMVEQLTDPEGIEPPQKLAHNMWTIARMDAETRWIKVADKLSNARDIVETQPRGWTQERVNFYVERAARVIARAGVIPEKLERRAQTLLGEKLDRARKAEPTTIAEHLARQIAFSKLTFGLGQRDAQIQKHIEHERIEAMREQNPERKLMEYIDIAMLAMDGAWRSGWDTHGGERDAAVSHTMKLFEVDERTSLAQWLAEETDQNNPNANAGESDEEIAKAMCLVITTKSDEQRTRSYANAAMTGFTAAQRHSGKDPEEVMRALQKKLEINERRKWPDWRERPTNEPMQHIRESRENQ